MIVSDAQWPDEPAFQDGSTAALIEDLVFPADPIADPPVLFVVAAGNDGNSASGTASGWEGDFIGTGQLFGSPAQEMHAFDGFSTYNVLDTDPQGEIVLQWAEPWGTAQHDYDLFLVDISDPANPIIIDESTDEQNGDDLPIESISSSSADHTGLALVVTKADAAEARFLQLEAAPAALAIQTSGQISGHAAAQAAIAVGAVPASEGAGPNGFLAAPRMLIEPFSADGPAHVFFEEDGTPLTPGNFSSSGGALRSKPDFAAASGVSTTVITPFSGSSAAAAHVAGLVALLAERFGTTDHDLIKGALTATALDIEDAGIDVLSGAGVPQQATVVADPDLDGVSSTSGTLDNCPWYPNPDQTETDGEPRGDLCLCGDQTEDGDTNINDILAINEVIFGLQPASPLCDATLDLACNVDDILEVNAEIFSSNETALCIRQPCTDTEIPTHLGGGAFSCSPTLPNTAPTLEPIGNQTVPFGSSLALAVAAHDVDGDAVVLAVFPLPLPEGATFDSLSGEFMFDPPLSQAGAAPISPHFLRH